MELTTAEICAVRKVLGSYLLDLENDASEEELLNVFSAHKKLREVSEMRKTVEVEVLGTTFTCEVNVFGPTVDDWEEISITSEGNLIEVLQNWNKGDPWSHYDELTSKISEELHSDNI